MSNRRPPPGAGHLLPGVAIALAFVAAGASAVDHGNPFFQSLGSNGRSCNSCHRQAEAWTMLRDVVDFYDTRFHIGLSEQQERDLVAFLLAL